MACRDLKKAKVVAYLAILATVLFCAYQLFVSLKQTAENYKHNVEMRIERALKPPQ